MNPDTLSPPNITAQEKQLQAPRVANMLLAQLQIILNPESEEQQLRAVQTLEAVVKPRILQTGLMEVTNALLQTQEEYLTRLRQSEDDVRKSADLAYSMADHGHQSSSQALNQTQTALNTTHQYQDNVTSPRLAQIAACLNYLTQLQTNS